MARRAVDLALDLARTPALARAMREQALPPDLLEVIRLAAGCPETSEAAVAATGKPLRVLRAAAVFYLEEILFFPGADLSRNLGVAVGTSKAQMRLHMRWLMQWLHPDHNPDETAALLAERVIHAWHELGRTNRAETTRPPETRIRSTRSNSRRHRRTIGVRWIPVPIPSGPSVFRRGVSAVVRVLVCAAVFALLFVPDSILFGRHAEPEKAVQAAVLKRGAALIDVKGE